MKPLPPPTSTGRRRAGRGHRTVAGTVPPLADPPKIETAAPTLIQVPEAPPEPVDPTRLTTIESEEFRSVLYELAARSCESLRLFEPTPEQERFFASECEERLCIGGNRGGKTTTTMVEIARAVTGSDPYDKYPKKDGIYILVAIDLAKCAKVFYRKLFLPGAFRIIKDLKTGEWRTFNPVLDSERIDESKKAPPLIPQRFIKSISWENKKDQQPKTVRLNNGWELWFFSSKGEWPQGVDVDGVAFDEELENEGWYGEMSARLADRRTKNTKTGKVRSGKFIWSATPQNGTAQLFELFSRSVEEKESYLASIERGEKIEPLTIETFMFGIDSNPWIAEHAKEAMKRKFAANPDEYKVRIEGEFALYGTRIYPEFTPKGVHGIEAFPVPEDWTVYTITDPGRQVCATLFVGVPPPSHELAGSRIVFDELYIKRCDALIFAREFVAKVHGRPIECGIIDHRGGRLTDIGSGKTAEQQYVSALKALGFKFECNGTSSFRWGSDDLKAGIQSVQNAMHIIDGKSELIVMRGKCPNLIKEMERYSYKKLPSGVVTDEPIKLNDHLVDCLRYSFAEKLRYVRPRRRAAKLGYTNEYLKQKKERARQKKSSMGGMGGSIKVG